MLLQSFGAAQSTVDNMQAILSGRSVTNIANTTGGANTTVVSYSHCPKGLYRNLQLGMKGSDVSELQRYLKSTGDYRYPKITGYYGPATMRAVQSFQRRMGIVSYGGPNSTGYGVVGPATRAKIQHNCINNRGNAGHYRPSTQRQNRPNTTIQNTNTASSGKPSTSMKQSRATSTKVSRIKKKAPKSCGRFPHNASQTRIRYKDATVDYSSSCLKEKQVRRCNNGKWTPWSGTYSNVSCKVQQMTCKLKYPTFKSLKITSGKYKNLWRHRKAGTINNYFMFSAMYHSDQFTNAERKKAVEAALEKLLVGKWMPNTKYTQGMKVSINGKLLEVNIAGTTGDVKPTVPSGASAGTFIYDGSAVWEYLGKDYPSSWEYFLVDISENLLTPIDVDSNDSYAAMLIATTEKFADKKWLNSKSPHEGFTNIQLLKKIADLNMESGINIPKGMYLSDTFQHQIKSDGQAYNIRFLADNAEVYAGYKALEKLSAIAGDASMSANARYLASIVKSGIVSLFDTQSGRFRTHNYQTNQASLNSCSAFVTDLRFHLWPVFNNVFTTKYEWSLYVKPVYNYTVKACPSVYSADLDPFPITEWFRAAFEVTKDKKALQTLIRRVDKAADNMPTIVDFALSQDACRLLKRK